MASIQQKNNDRLTELLSNNDRLTELLSTTTESITISKIQVQPYLRESNPKYYTPKLMSIGPIHHDKHLWQQGEKYKSMWAAKYLEGKCQEIVEHLLQKIVVDLPTLKGFYTEDGIEGHNDEDLAWIFFLDGCTVLYFLEKLNIGRPEELMIKVDQQLFVQHDILLLENQLPFQVLKLLSNHDDELQWFSVIHKFFITFNMNPDGVEGKEKNTTGTHDLTITVDQPIHLLHLLRNKIITKTLYDRKTEVDRKGDKSLTYTHRNIQELKASGIQVKSNEKNAMPTHIYFEQFLYFWGSLYLPKINVDDSTAPTLLNMITFEMCPDFENNYEISSYVAFMDSLIDNVDDVKDLRNAGVLNNALGSDEEVATLFNTISTNLVCDEEMYQKVNKDIEGHYTSKRKTWMAQAQYNYFSNPWSFLAFLGALTALILTFIQTWFAVYA